MDALTHKVPADGNCFFHSLAWNLNVDNVREHPEDIVTIGRNLRRTLITGDDWRAYVATLDPVLQREAPKFNAAAHPKIFSCDYIVSFLVWRYPISLYIFSDDRQDGQGIWTAKHHNDNDDTEAAMCLINFERAVHFQPMHINNVPSRNAVSQWMTIVKLYRALGLDMRTMGPGASVWCVRDLRTALGVEN